MAEAADPNAASDEGSCSSGSGSSGSDGSCLDDMEIREALEILDMARVLHSLETSVSALVSSGALAPDDPIVAGIERHTDGIAYYLSECGVEPDCSAFASDGVSEDLVADEVAAKSHEEVAALLERAAARGTEAVTKCVGVILGAIQESMERRKAASEKKTAPMSLEVVLGDLEALSRVFKTKNFFPRSESVDPEAVAAAIEARMASLLKDVQRTQPQPEPPEGPDNSAPDEVNVALSSGPAAVRLSLDTAAVEGAASTTVRRLISYRPVDGGVVEMAVPRKRIVQALTRMILDAVSATLTLPDGSTKETPLLSLIPALVSEKAA